MSKVYSQPILPSQYDATILRKLLIEMINAYNPVTEGRFLVTTVGALPPVATVGVGYRAMVTDANATTYASIVAAGGANTVPVFCDGTNWRIG